MANILPARRRPLHSRFPAECTSPNRSKHDIFRNRNLRIKPHCPRLCLPSLTFGIAGGRYLPVHHKHFFPQEPGFFEDDWFAPQRPGSDVVEHRGLKIGVLLCTELMFNEWARQYRRQGAHVIVVPRASGASRKWDVAASMAAIVSGCYVLSSNRAPHARESASNFGGRGFAYSPAGDLLAETSPSAPLASIDVDLTRIAEAQSSYPCYVREL